MKFAEEMEVEILAELGEPQTRPCPSEFITSRCMPTVGTLVEKICTRITRGLDFS